MDESPPTPGTSRLAAGIFAAVALLTIGALALTQELRSRPDIVNSVEKLGDGAAQTIEFNLTKAEPRATIEIVASDGNVVATPIAGEPLGPGRVRVEWDGKVEPSGAPAPAGGYRLRFEFDELGRRAFLPRKIRIREPAGERSSEPEPPGGEAG